MAASRRARTTPTRCRRGSRNSTTRKIPPSYAGKLWTLLASRALVSGAGLGTDGEFRRQFHVSVSLSGRPAQAARVVLRISGDGFADGAAGARWTWRDGIWAAAHRRIFWPFRFRRRTPSAIATDPTRASCTIRSCASTSISACSSIRYTRFVIRRASSFALTADHGVAPYPELRAQREHTTAGANRCFSSSDDRERADPRQGQATASVRFFEGIVTIDRDAVTKAGLKPDSILDALAKDMRKLPGVGARGLGQRSRARRHLARCGGAAMAAHASGRHSGRPGHVACAVRLLLDAWTWRRTERRTTTTRTCR